MGQLAELQYLMVDLLRRRRSLARSTEISTLAARHFTGNDRLRPVEQADIYREQFWLRHTSSLVEDFPGLGAVLGQSDWERLVEDYLIDHPPTSFTLRDLGHAMPEHVERSTWLPHHELCLDMARLEWLYVEVFDAPDAPGLDPEKLAAIPDEAWSTARIVLHPALRLLRTRYPVADLRRRARSAAGEDEPLLVPDPDARNLVLFRGPARSLDFEAVGDGAFALLEALRDGAPLVAAAERAVERRPEEAKNVEASVGRWFQQWGRRGWVADVVA